MSHERVEDNATQSSQELRPSLPSIQSFVRVYNSFDGGRFCWRLYLANLGGPPGIAPVDPLDDNVARELVDLARAGDETGFRTLAACVMPLEEIGECWAGARDRLGLPT